MSARLHPAERYARDVVQGRIVACNFVRKACQRHLDDLKHGAERGLVFDAKAAQRALNFIGLLRHSKGEWAGQPLVLEPWQQFITWCIFGWKRASHERWIIERDYEELKQELGLGHFEGRNWRGFHHHATLCIAAYGFLVAERNRFSPSARAGHLGFAALGPAPDFRPRGSPRTPRAT